ncbi:MAG: Fic family protein [Bacilli bacterium]|nr:Fic family protein [Bacilli bacterium]MDD4298259.1 Fic family protein [Bacilli bacterium]MDD4643751.1 Fic family protein [Bacilli bacterium]
MIDVFSNDLEFFDYYLKMFATRCTDNCFSSYLYYLENEVMKNNPGVRFDLGTLELIRQNTLEGNINAVNYLYKNEEIINLYPHHIQQAAAHINDAMGIAYGYRKTAVAINRDVSFAPAPAQSIPSKMMSLLDNYHNIWNVRDIFEREALLHIKLVRIQPFEDGNKRVAQFITGYNLFRNGYAPIIIAEADKEKYLSFIDNDDVGGFASFIKEKTQEELEYINKLRKEFDATKGSVIK